MKKINFLVVMLMMLCAGFMSSCSDDDEPGYMNKNYLDGIYSKENLTVVVDGEQNTSVESAEVKTTQKVDGEKAEVAIALKNFPAAGQSLLLKSVVDLKVNTPIQGEVKMAEKDYVYVATFSNVYEAKKTCQIVFTAK